MNTGIPYGGGSPHGSNPTSNIRFPISTAPVDSYISSTIPASVSVLASNCQSESRPGSFPSNGVPTLALGSVMKPSSDIEISDLTLPITALLIASFFEELDSSRYRTHRPSLDLGANHQHAHRPCPPSPSSPPAQVAGVSGSWPRARPGTRSNLR